MSRSMKIVVAVIVLTCCGIASGDMLLDSFHKSDPIQNMPDFGQVSQNWCWAAAAANSLYWYAKHGYPGILDDPLTAEFDQDLDDPNGVVLDADGRPHNAHRLVIEVARVAGIRFCKPTYKGTYLNTLNRFLQEHNVDVQARPADGLEVHDIIVDPYLLFASYAGPYSDPSEPPDPAAPEPEDPPEEPDPLIAIEYRNPTLDDLRRELGRCQDVLLWLAPDGDGMRHVVTAEGWEKTPTGWKVFVSDSWTPSDPVMPGPDTNTDPDRATHEAYDVISTIPLRIAYRTAQRNVEDMIFISPTPEPATLVLLALGGLALVRKRQNRGLPLT